MVDTHVAKDVFMESVLSLLGGLWGLNSCDKACSASVFTSLL